MKITNKTKAYWLASETSQGIKVWFMVNKGLQDKVKTQIGDNRQPVVFETLEEVKKYCKGEIVFTKRKVTTSRTTVVSK
jgi:hypothetical protein